MDAALRSSQPCNLLLFFRQTAKPTTHIHLNHLLATRTDLTKLQKRPAARNALLTFTTLQCREHHSTEPPSRHEDRSGLGLWMQPCAICFFLFLGTKLPNVVGRILLLECLNRELVMKYKQTDYRKTTTMESSSPPNKIRNCL